VHHRLTLKRRCVGCGRRDSPHSFQLDWPTCLALEQADAVAEEHGDEVDLELVEQAGSQVLPHDVGAAPDPDVLLAAPG
jgi:hypothetical protein